MGRGIRAWWVSPAHIQKFWEGHCPARSCSSCIGSSLGPTTAPGERRRQRASAGAHAGSRRSPRRSSTQARSAGGGWRSGEAVADGDLAAFGDDYPNCVSDPPAPVREARALMMSLTEVGNTFLRRTLTAKGSLKLRPHVRWRHGGRAGVQAGDETIDLRIGQRRAFAAICRLGESGLRLPAPIPRGIADKRRGSLGGGGCGDRARVVGGLRSDRAVRVHLDEDPPQARLGEQQLGLVQIAHERIARELDSPRFYQLQDIVRALLRGQAALLPAM